MITTHLVLKWLHIIALVYWLGGEWGVFQTSYNVTNPRLSLDERRRHMETAYRIDILARTGIILLLPLGLHMGYIFNVVPFGADWLPVIWIAAALWLALCWAAFIKRGTDAGIKLTIWDERIRYVVIPVLFVTGLMSLFEGHPFTARWFAAKVFIFSLLLIIGLVLRFVMRHWTTTFRKLAEAGPNAELEARLAWEIGISRKLAYLYWIGIGSVAFIGVTKPF